MLGLFPSPLAKGRDGAPPPFDITEKQERSLAAPLLYVDVIFSLRFLKPLGFLKPLRFLRLLGFLKPLGFLIPLRFLILLGFLLF
jgi:hypothetical protein